ncbi:MAG: zinc-dependent metalloprotease [Bacteroidales bacterium]
MKRTTASLLFILAMITIEAQDLDHLNQYRKFEGFFNFYYDEGTDKIYLVVEEPGKEFLYVHSLSSGLGDNDIGLDRGQIGGEAVVYFRRSGDKMLLVQPNLSYRAVSDNENEVRAVEEAFARSVIYSFKIVDENEGRYLVDIGEMLFSDEHHVTEQLAQLNQGNYTTDPARSGIELSRTRAFPENVEFDVMLTYSGKPEGRMVGSVTPDAHHVTVNQHHSFVKLPDDNYTPREFHPQSGCIPISYMDYSTPVYEPVMKRYIIRHRLEKKEPGKALSKAVEPIVYYLDPGTPEPIRSALLEGGNWWEEAFRSIGFEDAFRVEMLPEGADPLDVRYNVIQWVHRSTRGWSYGNSVVDPRTGEIIKGHVSLGSLRVRQDFMIAQALVNRPYATDENNHLAMMDLALARIRQLSAHEIGHTLGFTHNFAASTNGRSSVMDYPHPLLTAENGVIKMDKAYDEGIGDWDRVTVAYAYSEFSGDEKEGLDRILTDARTQGLRFIADSDARAPGGAHPYAHLWDNGESAVKELQNVLEVRKVAMQNFSEDNIREGEPFSVLEDVFVPLYFYHRYQVEAVSKLVGGVEYSYSVKGDGTGGPTPLAAQAQREALAGLLHTLSPDVLMIPEKKLGLFPPRAYGYPRTRESFKGMTGITFDPLAPTASSAHFTLSLLLHPERANRLVQQHALDQGEPGLDEVVSSLIDHTIRSTPAGTGYREEVMHTVNFIVIDQLISLAHDDGATPQVQAVVNQQLVDLKIWLEGRTAEDFDITYRLAYIRQIGENKSTILDHLPEIPPGAPIGMDCLGN